MKVPTGGRKKKLKDSIATTDVADRDPQARRRRDHQDDQQERRRDGRRVRDVQPLHVDECDDRDGADAGPQASRIWRNAGHSAT